MSISGTALFELFAIADFLRAADKRSSSFSFCDSISRSCLKKKGLEIKI